VIIQTLPHELTGINFWSCKSREIYQWNLALELMWVDMPIPLMWLGQLWLLRSLWPLLLLQLLLLLPPQLQLLLLLLRLLQRLMLLLLPLLLPLLLLPLLMQLVLREPSRLHPLLFRQFSPPPSRR